VKSHLETKSTQGRYSKTAVVERECRVLSAFHLMEAEMKRTTLTESPFEQVARLIAGNPPPPWLISELEWLSQGIYADRYYERRRPTRRKLRNDFIAAKESTRLLTDLCASSINTLLLEDFGKIATGISAQLALLSEALTAGIAALQTSDGKTTRGANRARPPDTPSPKMLVAARISEAWRIIHGQYPGDRNHSAAAAAEALWVASGGRRSIARDIEEGWRLHFKGIRARRNTLSGLLSMWRTEFEQAKRRGRAPISYKNLTTKGGK
jgi:hypothetical protein